MAQTKIIINRFFEIVYNMSRKWEEILQWKNVNQ